MSAKLFKLITDDKAQWIHLTEKNEFRTEVVKSEVVGVCQPQGMLREEKTRKLHTLVSQF